MFTASLTSDGTASSDVGKLSFVKLYKVLFLKILFISFRIVAVCNIIWAVTSWLTLLDIVSYSHVFITHRAIVCYSMGELFSS